MIRAATAADSPVLQDIEVAAGAQFATVGLADVAAHDPFSIAELDAYAAAGRSWVAVDADGAVRRLRGGRRHRRLRAPRAGERPPRGAGHAASAGSWSTRSRTGHATPGYPAVTLTTFTDVEWNAPLYAHLGFRVLADDELGPGARVRCATTRPRLGLDPARRVCMRREVGAGG